MKPLFAGACLAGVLFTQIAAAAAPPSGLESLRRFFNEVQTYTARFTQVVLDDAQKPIQESSGRMWFQRPDKFRWNYEKPYKQQIVGDGERIWIYDEELQQVTVRPMTGGLAGTPAQVLAGKGRLEDQFVIKDAGTQGTMEVVQLVPKRKDGGFDEIRVGFEHGKIRMLEMVDGLGQTTRYTLRDGLENGKIDPARFTFVPPKGVDVVGE